MPRPIAFDLTRLFIGALGRTPRGIDRVDISVARRLFDDPSRSDVGLVPGIAKMGMVSARAAQRIADRVERHWREDRPAGGGEATAALHRWLVGSGAAPPEPPADSSGFPMPWHLPPMLAGARGSVLRPAARHVPQGAVYLNTGQALLGASWCFGWLDRRPDVKPVFLIHDMIPVLFPEYSGPALSRHHARAAATAARYAAAMLATSRAAAEEVRDALRRLGRPDMPIHIAPLPVSPTLLAGPVPDAAATPYFVTVGILDQRKNHRLLLHVWRDLLHRQGPGIPKLVIVGARGLRTTELHALIARSPGLAAVVRVVSDLPSSTMREVVAGARALLMPSFTEGFGLPLIEARALGVPIIASDIPAHREVGGADAVLLDPLDGPGWQAAIGRFAREGKRTRDPAPSRDWAQYFADVLPFLESLP